jgi:hypothetical protein
LVERIVVPVTGVLAATQIAFPHASFGGAFGAQPLSVSVPVPFAF